MKENETFVLSKAVEAVVISEKRTLVLPAGTVVTVVLVLGDPSSPSAYEVEAFLANEGAYALATVEASDASHLG